MKRLLLTVALLAAWSATAQPILRNSYSTNATGRTPNVLPTSTNVIYPLMVLNPDGTGADRQVLYSQYWTMTATNGSLAGKLRADSGAFTNSLTLNGSPVSTNSGSGDTTGTNIVTLTQTGTNISQMDFALLQFGGAFKLSLTNNGYVSAPANVATSPFRKAWLLVQQPSTGTCILQFTNGYFAWPEGVAPVVDTNNGSVSVFEFVTDVFTNGLVHGSLVPLSKLATNM